MSANPVLDVLIIVVFLAIAAAGFFAATHGLKD
jgi:hypothetical protein